MKNQIPVYLLIVGVGIVIGLLLKPSASPLLTDTSSSITTDKQPTLTPSIESDISAAQPSLFEAQVTQLKAQLNSLQTKLTTETEHRRSLETKLTSLEKAIDSSISQTVTENDNSRMIRTATRQNSPLTEDNHWFNEQALIIAGIDPGKANSLKNLYENAEMEKLYLRDQATREGWMGTERFQTAMSEINSQTESVRSELDEKEYDAYLYATGRANRIIVSSVLNNSPASQAGIQAGDAILKYDNKRIYSWTDLTSATRQGAPDAMVSVAIERNGQQQQLYVPRGPLGVRLTTDSIAP
ncbi:MAG: PDZ domain-containing protein [Gammaproteobacteria bacterium]|nr:PDZ domain-containing protein [Gammaproteobacteria bacterium]